MCTYQTAVIDDGGYFMNRLRVLLVDDEIMILEGFRRLFDWQGHDCEVIGEAADGPQALNSIDTLLPDLVIMDINIPIINGLKVIQQARARHPDMAFIIVSGYDDFKWCQEALRMQITDYILKPVDYEEFGHCIDRLKVSQFQKKKASAEKDTHQQRPILKITSYLQEHLCEEISLTLLSEKFHLNPQYISQLFRSEIGVNFLTYLTDIRMEHARKLLISTDLSITNIAMESGYSDYRVFTKVFKKAEGVTPSQYRHTFTHQ